MGRFKGAAKVETVDERLASHVYETGDDGKPIRPKRPNAAPAMISAAELQRRLFPPICWTVPGLVPEGLTLLCGKPKLGKSWLAMDLGLAVSRGQFTLGRKCDPGPVLYLALEDSDRRLKSRMERVAGNSPWPETFSFATEWPRLDQGGLGHVEGWLDRNPDARLVIIDTLATVRPPSRANENAHGSDYAAGETSRI